MAQDPSLQEMTLRQLRTQAVELEISRYSRMTKAELLQTIREVKADLFGVSKDVVPDPREQEMVIGAKYHAGGVTDRVRLADVDADLGELPEGYGQSRIVLLPRDPQWAYAYWDIPNAHKEELRRQGGQQLTLRLIDVSEPEGVGSIQEYPCTEIAREWYLPIPVSDRTYVVEIGYRTLGGTWLVLSRSAPVAIPPSHPSDWIDDRFVSIAFDQSLRGKTVHRFQEPLPASARAVSPESTWTQLRLRQDELLGLVAMPQQVSGSLSHLSQFKPWMVSGAGLAAFAVDGETESQIYLDVRTDPQQDI